MQSFGIEAFVAHEDIAPNQEWQRVIEAALRSCDACVALLHKGFPRSNWCDQEVGFVLSRNLPVIPVALDIQPYGFLGKIQSLRANNLDALALGPAVALSLLQDTRTGRDLTEHLVRTLVNAYSFDHANTVSGMLADHAPSISRAQFDAMREARQNNLQVRGGYSVQSNLRTIEKKFALDATVDLRGAAQRRLRARSGYDL